MKIIQYCFIKNNRKYDHTHVTVREYVAEYVILKQFMYILMFHFYIYIFCCIISYIWWDNLEREREKIIDYIYKYFIRYIYDLLWLISQKVI